MSQADPPWKSNLPPRVAFVSMMKDEGALISTWIRYHGSIVPWTSLFIFDNGSSDPETLKALDEARELGVTVRLHPGSSAFQSKGTLVLQLAAEKANEFDWFVPLDADEFIAVSDEQGLSRSRASILAEFQELGGRAESVVRVFESYWNIPGTTGGYRAIIQKVILRSDHSLNALDLGFHMYDWGAQKSLIPDKEVVSSKLCYLHFHNRPYGQLLASARRKLGSRVPDFTKKTLKSYKGDGSHLAKYFLQSQADYLGGFPQGEVDLAVLFSDLQLKVPHSDSSIGTTEREARVARSPVNLQAILGGFAMTAREVECLHDEIIDASHYVEYGAGGTTLLACRAGVQNVCSFETSLEFCTSIRAKLQLDPYIMSGRLTLNHIEIGEVGDWGYPIEPPTQEAVCRYVHAHRRSEGVEFALIDGRYRVACAISLLLRDKPPRRIAWHDYLSRDHYHALEPWFGDCRSVDDLIVFTPTDLSPEDRSRLNELLDRYLVDPR